MMPQNKDFDLYVVFTLDVLSRHPDFHPIWNSDFLNIHGMKTIDIVRWLNADAPPRERNPNYAYLITPRDSFWPYWEAFKVEFKVFLCTKNRKYSRLRRELGKQEGATQPALISLISATIGAQIGTIGVVIAPLVVLSVITVLKIGKEAYCRTVDIDSVIAVPPDKPPEPKE